MDDDEMSRHDGDERKNVQERRRTKGATFFSSASGSRRIFFGLLVLFFCSSNGDANFNLYISRREMNRTLGVVAEMSYVENGRINAYATKFPVSRHFKLSAGGNKSFFLQYRVAPNISHITFTWSAESSERSVSRPPLPLKLFERGKLRSHIR